MKPDEFTPFAKQKPEPRKYIIVTNNIDAQDAYGELSHVWITNRWIESKIEECIIMFDDAERMVLNLTHWKYA